MRERPEKSLLQVEKVIEKPPPERDFRGIDNPESP